ncbi:MAG: menaquinone-dependent protoporphyrinogen IX dehydrogenase [Rhodobacteraceae bacterium]|nr:MAG: menaquinone-dependent protoporphyrinogen IX dehydrogenase [Paracoccaceae bacterium]
MPLIRLYAATHDGHTARIAERISARVETHGAATDIRVLQGGDEPDTAGADLLALVAAVRYGKHLPAAEAFAAKLAAIQQSTPVALASVCLTARKPNKRTAEENPYLRKLIARHQLNPVAAHAFAGKLDYPRYRFVDRQMIRLIMWITGGPTDGVSVIEYTDWSTVDSFADQLAAAVEPVAKAG